MAYDREIKYAHPFIQDTIKSILAAIQNQLPASITCRYISVHRTPTDQFELFKQGRTFKEDKWVVTDKSKVVTGKDGFINKSRHNYLPATAFDIGLFDSHGKYLLDSPHYKQIALGKDFGFDWGGNWKTLIDQPHLEIAKDNFFQEDIGKDNGYVWQWYLIKAGSYTGAHDGLFGTKSLEALRTTTGETQQNLKAWDTLVELLGKIEADALSEESVNVADSFGDRPKPKRDRSRPWPIQAPRPFPPFKRRPHP